MRNEQWQYRSRRTDSSRLISFWCRIHIRLNPRVCGVFHLGYPLPAGMIKPAGSGRDTQNETLISTPYNSPLIVSSLPCVVKPKFSTVRVTVTVTKSRAFEVPYSALLLTIDTRIWASLIKRCFPKEAIQYDKWYRWCNSPHILSLEMFFVDKSLTASGFLTSFPTLSEKEVGTKIASLTLATCFS